MKVKSESEVAQSCLTLHDPMDCSSSAHGIFQARGLEWGAIVFTRGDFKNICHSICVIWSAQMVMGRGLDGKREMGQF